MRNLKRALSLALASVMLLGMMVVGSSAASFPDVDANDNIEAIEVLNAVGVMVGDEGTGTFRPDSPVTRNEMAVVMAKLMLGTYEANSYVGTHPFNDVPEWASRYVAACYASGIVAGRGNGIYDGASYVTAVEAAAMMLRALGYEDLSKNAERWDQPVAAKANEINLFKGLNGNGNATMDRDAVAKLALNTLQATMVTTVHDSADVNIGNVSIAGIVRYVDRADVSPYDYTAASDVGDSTLQLCEYLYDNDLKLDVGTDDLMRETDKWQYKGDDVVEIAKDAWKTVIVNPDDSATISNVVTSKDYFNVKASDVAASPDYYLNGDSVASNTALQAGDVVELYRDTNNKVDTVIVTRYTLAKVDKVDDDVSSADAKDGTSCYVTLKQMNDAAIDTYNDNDFNGFNAGTYTEGTFLAIARNAALEIVDSHEAKTAEGRITAYKTTKAVTLGGTTYNLAGTLATGSITTSTADFDGTNYIAYMTNDNYVLGIDGAEAVKLDDVYYVHSVYYTKTGNEKTSYYAQVVDMDGVESEIQIEETSYKDTIKTIANAAPDATNANKFNAVQKLYTFSDKDAVAAGGTNYGGQSASVAAKANNGKLSAKAYITANTNGDYGVANAANNALDTLAAEIKTSSKSVTVTTGDVSVDGSSVSSAYIDSTTKFLLIEPDATTPTKADLEIEVLTGSAKVDIGKKAFVIASKDGSSYVANVVIVVDASITSGTSDEVIYLGEQPTVEVKDGYETEKAYFMDGTKKTIVVDSDYAIGFYTYKIKDDGAYELTASTKKAYDNAADFEYDDETGIVANFSSGSAAATPITSIYHSKLITFDQFSDTNDIDFKDVTLSSKLQVVDVRTSANKSISAYKNEINTLEKLETAMSRDTVSAMAYADKGEILLIAVDSMPDARSADTTVKEASATVDVGASITGVTAAVDNSAHTIQLTITGTAANGDKITVTATPNHAGASASGSITLTYNSTGTTWGTASITITAENTTSTQAYTVSVP